MKKIFLIIQLVFFIALSGNAQNKVITKDWLLLNLDIQLEANDAINHMYNFKFDLAEAKFLELKKRYPEHPIAYFLMGLSNYWKIYPNILDKSHDETFHNYMDSAITKAEVLYDQNEKNLEAAFFLTSSYGLKGRVYAMHKEYMSAANVGRKALKYLNLDDKDNEISPEFYLGTALYNYYREDIYEEYYLLRPVIKVVSSKKGDKELGIKQLNEVALNAFYTRTEANTYLLEIYLDYEKDKSHLAYPIAKSLHESYPDNPQFHYYYAKACYKDNKPILAEKLGSEYIDKYNKHLPGYNDVGLRSLSFYLANGLKHVGQIDKATTFYTVCLATCEKTKKTYGYYIFSLDALAELADKKNDFDLAEKYCKKIIKYADKDNESELESYNKAKTYLKNLKARKKAFKEGTIK